MLKEVIIILYLIIQRGIPVEYGVKIKEIKKNEQQVVFQDIKSGNLTIKPYGAIYALPPTIHHQNLVDAGLANKQSNNLLDVDPETL